MTSTQLNRLDMVTMHVIRRHLESICDEMLFNLVRTSRSSTTVYEYDCSAGVFDSDGNLLSSGLVAYGHMPAVSICLGTLIPRYQGNINPGDMFIVNDIRSGAMHLNDIYLMKPVFSEDRLIAWSAVVIHHMDVGGKTPGSMGTDSTEIFQEGLQIPLAKLYDRGVLNSVILAFIERNVRVPQVVLGDIQGQEAACNTGEQRLKDMAVKYGSDTLSLYMQGLMDYSEQVTRAAIASWPDGTSEAIDYLDDDGVTDEPIPFHVKVTIQGDQITFDFTGSALQVQGALNCGIPEVRWFTQIAMAFAMGPELDIPYNGGFWRPVLLVAPEGTIINATHPAARGARGVTIRRILEVSQHALAQLLPGRLPACPHGDVGLGRFSYVTPNGQVMVRSEMVSGIPGGCATHDGADGLGTSCVGVSNVPVEILERSLPVRVRRYEYVPDTSGPGKYRGGLAITREWEIMAPEMRLTFRSDRRKFPPWGLEGGGKGTTSQILLKSGEIEQLLPTKVNILLKQGEVFHYTSAGGGGYGKPLDRDPQAVFWDWRNEKITAAHALEAYGVVIDTVNHVVDEKETLDVRRLMANCDPS